MAWELAQFCQSLKANWEHVMNVEVGSFGNWLTCPAITSYQLSEVFKDFYEN